MIATLRRMVSEWVGTDRNQRTASDSMKGTRHHGARSAHSAAELAGKQAGSGEPKVVEAPAVTGQRSLWIRNAKERAAHLSPDRDGRIRVRGSETVDICASPARFSDAVAIFSGWLDALHQAGIATEIRGTDGWRVCAVVDGAALAIRVRERLVRLPALGGANQRLERLLGGGRREVLAPSGVLELQVMRHGVCAVAIPVEASTASEAYSESIKAILSLKERELSYQKKARTRAEMRRSAPLKTALAAATQPALAAQTGAQSGTSETQFHPQRDASDAQRVADLLLQLEATLRRMQPAMTESLNMRTSLDRLATMCYEPRGSEDELGLAGLQIALEAGNTPAPRPILAKRKRVVA